MNYFFYKIEKKLFIYSFLCDKIIYSKRMNNRGGTKVGFIKRWLSSDDQDVFEPSNDNNAYYTLNTEDALNENDGKNKMILLEPRAYSESQQIADFLKSRNTVVVNLKRVTSDQAKRIVDFLSGTIYAIGGDLQKIGS